MSAPCTLAMPASLYRYARAQGMAVVHMIADPAIGSIHRGAGCRAVDAFHRRAKLVLRADRAEFRSLPSRKRVAHEVLAAGQRVAFATALAAGLAGKQRVRVRPGSELAPAQWGCIAADIPAVTGWTLAIDPPTLMWLARAGESYLIALEGAPENYALICRRAGMSQAMELLLWRQPEGGLRSALRLLGAVMEGAHGLGVDTVGCSLDAAWHPAERERLVTAGRLLLLYPRTQLTGMYVYTRDRYYLDPRNLRFTPLFSSIF
jgi:hypothetical protein